MIQTKQNYPPIKYYGDLEVLWSRALWSESENLKQVCKSVHLDVRFSVYCVGVYR